MKKQATTNQKKRVFIMGKDKDIVAKRLAPKYAVPTKNSDKYALIQGPEYNYYALPITNAMTTNEVHARRDAVRNSNLVLITLDARNFEEQDKLTQEIQAIKREMQDNFIFMHKDLQFLVVITHADGIKIPSEKMQKVQQEIRSSLTNNITGPDLTSVEFIMTPDCTEEIIARGMRTPLTGDEVFALGQDKEGELREKNVGATLDLRDKIDTISQKQENEKLEKELSQRMDRLASDEENRIKENKKQEKLKAEKAKQKEAKEKEERINRQEAKAARIKAAQEKFTRHLTGQSQDYKGQDGPTSENEDRHFSMPQDGDAIIDAGRVKYTTPKIKPKKTSSFIKKIKKALTPFGLLALVASIILAATLPATLILIPLITATLSAITVGTIALKNGISNFITALQNPSAGRILGSMFGMVFNSLVIGGTVTIAAYLLPAVTTSIATTVLTAIGIKATVTAGIGLALAVGSIAALAIAVTAIVITAAVYFIAKGIKALHTKHTAAKQNIASNNDLESGQGNESQIGNQMGAVSQPAPSQPDQTGAPNDGTSFDSTFSRAKTVEDVTENHNTGEKPQLEQ